MNTTADPATVPSIGLALGNAWAGMKQRLFQPFAIGAWFALGFGAWLAMVDEFVGQLINIPIQFADVATEMTAVGDVLSSIPLALLIAAGVVAVMLLVVGHYLSTRGRFLFIGQLAEQTTAIGVPWRRAGGISLNYFLWTLALGFVMAVVVGLIVFVPAFLLGLGAVFTEGAWPTAGLITMLVLLVFLVLPLTLAVVLVLRLLVPLMWLHQCDFPAALRQTFACIAAAPGTVLLFGLTLLGLQTLYTLTVLAAGLLTCCCGFVLLMIPYLGTVAMLPILLFDQLYTLEFLRGFGPEADVFPPGPQPGPDIAPAVLAPDPTDLTPTPHT